MEVKAIAIIPHSDAKGTSVEMEVKPIILCEDCKHYDEKESFCNSIGMLLFGKDGKWYCADGEPKDGWYV